MTEKHLPLHRRNTRSSGCSAHRSPVHWHNLRFSAHFPPELGLKLVRCVSYVALGVFLHFEKMYIIYGVLTPINGLINGFRWGYFPVLMGVTYLYLYIYI